MPLRQHAVDLLFAALLVAIGVMLFCVKPSEGTSIGGGGFNYPSNAWAVIGDSNAQRIRFGIYGDSAGSNALALYCQREMGRDQGSSQIALGDDWADEYIADGIIPGVVVVEHYGNDIVEECATYDKIPNRFDPSDPDPSPLVLEASEITRIVGDLQDLIDKWEAAGATVLFAEGIGVREESCSSRTSNDCVDYSRCVDAGYISVSQELNHSPTIDLRLPETQGFCSVTTGTACATSEECPTGTCNFTTSQICNTVWDCPKGFCSSTTSIDCYSIFDCPILESCLGVESCLGGEYCANEYWESPAGIVGDVHASFLGRDYTGELLSGWVQDHFANSTQTRNQMCPNTLTNTTTILACSADPECVCEEKMEHSGTLGWTAAAGFDYADSTSKECGSGVWGANASSEIQVINAADGPALPLGHGRDRVTMVRFQGAGPHLLEFVDNNWFDADAAANLDDTACATYYTRWSRAGDHADAEDWPDIGSIAGDDSERRKLLQLQGTVGQAQVQIWTSEGNDFNVYPELYTPNHKFDMDDLKDYWFELALCADGNGDGTWDYRYRAKKIKTGLYAVFAGDLANVLTGNFGYNVPQINVQNVGSDPAGNVWLAGGRVYRRSTRDSGYWPPPDCEVEPNATGC